MIKEAPTRSVEELLKRARNRFKKRKWTRLILLTIRGEKKYEEYAYILDYLPHGRLGKGELIQLIGESYFTLLDASINKESNFEIGDRIFIGRNDRKLVKKILGRIPFWELSLKSSKNLPTTILKILPKKEKLIVDLFNYSPSISQGTHTLERIGLTKTCLFRVLNERKKGYFKSIFDISRRTGIRYEILIDLLLERVLYELAGE